MSFENIILELKVRHEKPQLGDLVVLLWKNWCRLAEVQDTKKPGVVIGFTPDERAIVSFPHDVVFHEWKVYQS